MSLRTDIVRVKTRAEMLKERQDNITGALKMLNEYMDHINALMKASDPRGLEMWRDRKSFATWLQEQNEINLTGVNMLQEELESIEAGL